MVLSVLGFSLIKMKNKKISTQLKTNPNYTVHFSLVFDYAVHTTIQTTSNSRTPCLSSHTKSAFFKFWSSGEMTELADCAQIGFEE